jgi:hypothetical protein
MVVVVIIGILSAIAVPRFLAVSGQSQLDGDANTLFLDLQWAKAAVVRTGKPCLIAFKDSLVDGQTRTAWAVVDSATRGVMKSGLTGVSVRIGLPAGVAAPALPLFGGLPAGAAGFRGGLDTTGQQWCKNGTGANESWSDSAKVCGGATGNMETGAVYLYSTRSDAEAYAIVYNRSKALSLKRCRYLGGTWEVL